MFKGMLKSMAFAQSSLHKLHFGRMGEERGSERIVFSCKRVWHVVLWR
jgi:hypothetical protein